MGLPGLRGILPLKLKNMIVGAHEKSPCLVVRTETTYIYIDHITDSERHVRLISKHFKSNDLSSKTGPSYFTNKYRKCPAFLYINLSFVPEVGAFMLGFLLVNTRKWQLFMCNTLN